MASESDVTPGRPPTPPGCSRAPSESLRAGNPGLGMAFLAVPVLAFIDSPFKQFFKIFSSGFRKRRYALVCRILGERNRSLGMAFLAVPGCLSPIPLSVASDNDVRH